MKHTGFAKFAAAALIFALLALAAAGCGEITGTGTSDAPGSRDFVFDGILAASVPAAWGERTADDGAVGLYDDEDAPTKGMSFVSFAAGERSAEEWAESLAANEENCSEITQRELGEIGGTPSFDVKLSETDRDGAVREESWRYYVTVCGEKTAVVGVLADEEGGFGGYDDILATVTAYTAPEEAE